VKQPFRIKLFASFADLFGASHLEIVLPQGSTVADLSNAIRQLPRAAKLPARLVVAVNSAYAAPETPLSFGDEIALIPPVAGG
jgi:Molybdopterin converting factor, small subunit